MLPSTSTKGHQQSDYEASAKAQLVSSLDLHWRVNGLLTYDNSKDEILWPHAVCLLSYIDILISS